MYGVMKQGTEDITDRSVGTRFQRGMWIRRLQGRIHKNYWRRVMKSTLLCLPHRLGQNAWVRIGQFIRRKPISFLALVGLDHLGSFVGIGKTFVANRRMWRQKHIYQMAKTKRMRTEWMQSLERSFAAVSLIAGQKRIKKNPKVSADVNKGRMG